MLRVKKVIVICESQSRQSSDPSMAPKIMFDDSPNDKPNGSMLFGQLIFEAYQLSPPEVCWLINMLNVTHTHKMLTTSFLYSYCLQLFEMLIYEPGLVPCNVINKAC